MNNDCDLEGYLDYVRIIISTHEELSISSDSSDQEILYWIKSNTYYAESISIISNELIEEYNLYTIFNNGGYNTGYLNSGYYNSGIKNFGNTNSGDMNVGNRNSGNNNVGYRNSGEINNGEYNSGYNNYGYYNSGDLNCGDLNSGYINCGYGNSGVFCNKKKEDKILLFNKESNMTWDEWESSKVYNIISRFKLNDWVEWNRMSDKEKIYNIKAYLNGGYLKKYTYKEAWKNLWDSLNDDEKKAFEYLPNFDSEIFEDITGIKIN